MKRKKNDRLLLALGEMRDRIPPLLTEMGFQRDRCILHTRVACLALGELGFRARPLACKVLVANQAWLDLREELGRPPLTVAEMEGTEAWSLGIGHGRPDNGRPGYDGHVVAIAEERYALDLTIDQATREQRGIVPLPGVFPAPKQFLTGKGSMGGITNGTYLEYEAMPDDRGFLHAGDWWRVRANDPNNPVPRILREMMKVAT